MSAREELFEELFEIAAKYNLNMTNNYSDEANGLFHIGDFCGDILDALLAAGFEEPK